ncbi:DUF1697 domain-containing protein [Cellulomonas pakistanensis]|uniref:DUF1697 domain-containing protein n=1 Tax=Cellulomonas pakistanensis TaxID=992287 RepID=A0A919PAP6_9CELL|nr:DUF1697 domain-containing protein [Cellulomonas pakistanensis]GIG35167.1 hypothetical protein Cpa01nite_05480 [Cellulomonas pakistanensis]
MATADPAEPARADDPAAPGPVVPGERVLVLLRAVNVGGTSALPMADLRAAAVDLGHGAVATHLTTGNLLLVPGPGSPADLAGLAAALTADLAARLGRALALTVRTRAQVDDLVAANPYPGPAASDPSHLVVVFLDGPAAHGGRMDLAGYGRERGTWRGSEGYVHYPDGIGRSKVTAGVLDRMSGRTGTARNWRTVLALQEKLAA